MRKMMMAVLILVILTSSAFAATIEEANFNGDAKLSYPVVHLADSAVENKINGKIMEEMMSFIK